MPSLARDAAIRNIGARNGELSDKRAPRTPLIEIFAQNVFNDTVQRQRLPKATYKALQRIRASGEMLDLSIADAVANAMRDWAVERGATHFTHWFQPMTGLTAEKHDSFLTLTGDDRIINEFSGTSLVKGEPDASSFPSGGLRSTFEARGYTVWDPTSPAILREGPDGLTLLIPTTFCSWTGEALDKKTPLLRSDQAISKAATRLVNLLGNDRVERVFSTIGCEQEYFLIDREFVQLRPDLLSSGRTLFGAKPPKGQELDDHYFGAISQRALGFMQDVERELWKLGIPITTRHNEVAPLQFEFAPIYRPSAVAVDQNMLTMEILKKIADRHGFKCLLHEKPFAGVNGSGKHMNWSMEDNLGNNLLDPGTTPHDNAQFMLFLTAIIRAVHLHGDLMRVAIAHAGNDHRLGANEAPPAIISIFLGAELEEIVQALIDERPPKTASDHALRLGLDSLPEIPKDATDRNRTSPFAFTGQKFEFRAVGSSQSAAYPATFLNTVVAESIDYLCDEIEKRRSQTDSRRIVGTLVTETLRQHQAILFSGDNYSEKWEVMAVKERKLPNLKGTPAALAQFGTSENAALFSKMNVFSERETASRQNVLYETYTSAIRIEALSTYELGQTSIMPAAMKHQGQFADSILKTKQACPDLNLDTEEAMLTEISQIITALKKGLDDLRSRLDHLEESQGSEADHAIACRNEIIPSMDFVREQGDRLETLIDDDLWPLPKYREMLFIH